MSGPLPELEAGRQLGVDVLDARVVLGVLDRRHARADGEEGAGPPVADAGVRVAGDAPVERVLADLAAELPDVEPVLADLGPEARDLGPPEVLLGRREDLREH